MIMGKQLHRSKDQRGAVLLVALILLLVTTFVGFSTMETSNLESKMATTREVKEQTFQAAEASIEFALDDLPMISAAYVEGRPGRRIPTLSLTRILPAASGWNSLGPPSPWATRSARAPAASQLITTRCGATRTAPTPISPACIPRVSTLKDPACTECRGYSED